MEWTQRPPAHKDFDNPRRPRGIGGNAALQPGAKEIRHGDVDQVFVREA